MRKDYLDGLRGWAALVVLIGHIGNVLLSNQRPPVLPFFADGQLAVYIFFVLSAYVLSVGYLEKKDPNIPLALAIRRYPRLTIPIITSCTIAFFLVEIGAMVNIPAGALAKSPWLESFYNFPVSVESLLKFSLLDVYVDANAASYNAVLWTMRYEFWGSLTLLASLWSLRTCKNRIVGYIVATAACSYYESPLFAFVLGVILADAKLQLHDVIGAHPRITGLISCALLFAALLAGMFRPQLQWWSPISLSVMAGCILAAIILNLKLQQALSGQLSKFLGYISFPLYLTHLLVICSWSSWLYLELTSSGYSSWIISASITLSTVALSIGVALIFTPVEKLAIRVGKLLSDALLPRLIKLMRKPMRLRVPSK